jgi:hypothetical protein
MIELDKSKNFKYNLEAGVLKDVLMQYYIIKTDREWDNIMESIKTAESNSKKIRKKIIMGKENEGK